MAPRTVRTIPDLRRALAGSRAGGERIAMVPTMGALHAGHLALVEEAKRRAERTLVSIFVNPAQFGPAEDLATYPREEAGDLAKLAAHGVDLVFAPDAGEIYPPGFDLAIRVGGPSAGLESDARPHFFTGVATVVAKLLTAALPDEAMFGEKDYQQLLVVRKLVRDLNLPVEIVACPTVREADGLALSSRNAYLSDEERRRAPALFSALSEAAAAIGTGGAPAAALARAREALTAAGFAIDYLELRDADSLEPVTDLAGRPLRLLAAARLGATRLIDNVPVGRPNTDAQEAVI
jgi:pantoate--beta-alanine ligase